MLTSLDPGWEPPDLPEPYFSSWELWVDRSNGEVQFVVLNLYQFGLDRCFFVRTVTDVSQDRCIEEACAWIDARSECVFW